MRGEGDPALVKNSRFLGSAERQKPDGGGDTVDEAGGGAAEFKKNEEPEGSPRRKQSTIDRKNRD